MEENTNTTTEQTTQGAEATTAADVIDTALNEAVAETISPSEQMGESVTPVAEKPNTDQSVSTSETTNDEQKNETESKPDFSKEQELFDRAIRAGLSSKDVLSIPNRSTVERMVEMAEKANGISQSNPDQQNGVAENPEADSVESVIEAMQKEGGYDANLMKLLGGLVSENKKLRSAGESAERQSFFDKQIGTLDEGIRRHVDAVHASQLKAKFDLLKAGYRAQGSKIGDEDVFQEAARLALGDLMAKASEERKASTLEQRRNLTLARPGGENGQHRHHGPMTEADIANEIWDQINN